MTTVIKTSQNYSKDSLGTAVGSMTFYVGAKPDTLAITELAASPDGTTYDAEFPGDPSITCDAIDGTPAADGVGTELVARFSSDGSHQIHVLKKSLQIPLWSRSWEKVNVSIPINVREYVNWSPVKGGALERTGFWTIEKIQRAEKREVFACEVKFKIPIASEQPARLRAIGNQQDKLHQFTGASQLFRFEAGTVRQLDATEFTCPYSWLGDRGTTRTPDMVDDVDKVIWPLAYPAFPGLVRKPFSEFIVYPSSEPRNIYHDVRCIEMYDRSDLEGWKTLPGIPSYL